MSKSKLKILGTGLSGLVGSRVVELLKDKYDFEDLSLETGVDITDKDKVLERVSKSNSGVVLHMAAYTNVDGSEQQCKQGVDSLTWRVNVEGTKNIVQAVKYTSKRLIHISTDFVFSGLEDKYTEESKPNPINWYGETKFRAELAVQEELENYAILRLAFPYRARSQRPDIVRFFMDKLQKGQTVRAVSDWIITPTFIDDISVVIESFISNMETGIYHTVGSSSMSAFDTALVVAEAFGFDKKLVTLIKLNDLFANKAPRPKRLIIDNGKITGLGLQMKTLKEGLNTIKKQLE